MKILNNISNVVQYEQYSNNYLNIVNMVIK